MSQADFDLKVTNANLRRVRLQKYAQDPKRVGKGRHHWRMRMPYAVDPGFEDWLLFGFASMDVRGKKVMQALKAPVGPKIDAWVENNRWIARCECAGQEVVDPEDPRFYCWSCFNFLSKGRTRKLDFGAHEEIELVLMARPDPLNRNIAAVQDPKTLKWKRLENPDDLEAENLEHGFPARINNANQGR